MVPESDRNNVPNFILDNLLLCNAGCAGDFVPHREFYEEDMIDWLYHNLPTMPYVIDQIVNFIFSDNLTTGDDEQDKKLEAFLYAKNIKGATNYSVLREGIKEALIYGKNGIRWLDENAGLINVKSLNYACLVEKDKEHYGFDDIVGFIVAMDGQKIWETKLDELEFDESEFIRRGILVDKDRQIMIISPEEFLNLRNDTTKDDGDSPLKYDKQRTRLLTSIYERLNYDIEYDGPGRILLKLKSGFAGGDENEISTSEVLDQSTDAKDGRRDKVLKEATEIGKKIKTSGSDSVIVVSDAFEDEITHLPKVTKATDFLDWLDGEGVIISQIFSIQPTLLGLGKISGNVSMEKIIDNAMINGIVPLREKFATQISSFLAEKLGVDKIYFDKYEMKQAVDENDKRIKVVNMIEKLEKVGRTDTANMLDQMLQQDLEASDGGVKNLAARFLNKFKQIKKLLGGNKDDRHDGSAE